MSVLVQLRDASDLPVARRRVRELGREQGLSAVAIEALATAVTEIAQNALVHAGGGELRIEAAEPPRRGVVVTARDAGPGISDVPRAMCDGYTTAAGLGLGLPSARRLVDEFAIESTVGGGTCVCLRKWVTGDLRVKPESERP